MKKLTREQFLLKAREIHGWKYDYSKVEYENNKKSVCIICQEHGEFWQKPGNHLLGQGCKKCYGNYKNNTEDFIKKARKIHGDKYDYSKVEYSWNKEPVCIICPEHGGFWQKPNAHLSGCGCRECSYKNTPRRKRKEIDEFIRDAKLVHGDKYDYSIIDYVNNKTKICIICHNKDKFGKEHGEFWQRPDNHLNGQECPKCVKKISKLEQKIKEYLTNNGIIFEEEKKFDWLENLRLDFYLPEYKVGIECQGLQHFEPVDFAGIGKNWAVKKFNELIERDNIKKFLCEKNGVDIIYYTNKELKEKYAKNYISDLRLITKFLKLKKNE